MAYTRMHILGLLLVRAVKLGTIDASDQYLQLFDCITVQ